MILALCKSCGTLFEDNFVHNTISLKILPEREIDLSDKNKEMITNKEMFITQ